MANDKVSGREKPTWSCKSLNVCGELDFYISKAQNVY